jgi:hypothetical protein
MVLHGDENLGEQLRQASRREENYGFTCSDSSILSGFPRVNELIVSDETKDVYELIGSRREDSVVLRNVKMSVDFVGGDRVDVGVIFFQRFTSDFSNLFRYRCREEERLAMIVVRDVLDYGRDVVRETHIEECVGFVENEHSRVGDDFTY